MTNEEIVALTKKLHALGVRRWKVGDVEIELGTAAPLGAHTLVEDVDEAATPEERQLRALAREERNLFHSSG